MAARGVISREPKDPQFVSYFFFQSASFKFFVEKNEST